MNAGFTFRDARRVVPYLAALGISDIYSSPILRARKGSTHGYDIVDPTRINPELGSDEDFAEYHDTLKEHALGFLLDTVPNHLAASPENAWWMSVLENGPHSRYVHYFDIDWSVVQTHERTTNKLLLPILGRPYGEVLIAQEITLGFDVEGFFFTYFEHRLPLSPDSYRWILRRSIEVLPPDRVAVELRELATGDGSIPNSKFLKETVWRIYEQDLSFREALDGTLRIINGDPSDEESFDELDQILEAQWYRLAYWRIAREKINYRRFFDVTELVGVRIENPEVFEVRNRLLLDLIAEGKVTGLRIDHIDGLHDPIGHMRKMQLRLAPAGERGVNASAPVEQSCDVPAANADTTPRSQHIYIVLEKILAPDEELRREFDVAGTTGYDFLDLVNSLFIDGPGIQRLTNFYQSFAGERRSFDRIAYERKKDVIHLLFSGEMRSLGKQLSALALLDRNARDFAPSELLAALVEITACLDVYRTYIREETISKEDEAAIRRALERARALRGVAIDGRIFKFLELVLLVDPPTYLVPVKTSWLAFVMRWQQFTGRVMAKGVEDTAFYNYTRLLSMNEVGGHPSTVRDDPLAAFHDRNDRVAQHWPDTMNATSTHDTKRSEDVRARINVLSDMAETWEREVRRWSRATAPLRQEGVPAPNEELFIYQTLVGMWPLVADEESDVLPRLQQYLEKAAREAKQETSWIEVNPEYEARLQRFTEALLGHEGFLSLFQRFQRRVAFFGFLNSLSQLVLKITAPGVPDFYQGTELFDLTLVDPDNRRPVDYEHRHAALKKLQAAHAREQLDLRTLLRRWFDGRVKLFVTWRALDVRTRHADTFRRGSYRRIDAGTPHLCAFARGADIIVAVPRLLAELTKVGEMPAPEVWGDATLSTGGGSRWRNAFTGEIVEGSDLRVGDVLKNFPVAILERA